MDNKLEKYKNYVLGFAYEVGAYEINTYLVINKISKISFIPYKYYDFNTKNKIEEFVNELKLKGYKPINNWEENKNIKKLIKK